MHDYGIDLVVYTYDANGEVESEVLNIQMKATDHLPLLQDQQTIPFAIERADLERWLAETMPVLLILYDAQGDVAYWLYVQAYFAQQPDFRLAAAGETITVHLKRDRIVNENAIRAFARFKESIARQIQGVSHHDE